MGNNTYFQYKIKKEVIGKNSKAFGLTIPIFLAEKFGAIKFNLYFTNDSIIFRSGADLKQLRKDIGNIKIEDLEVNGAQT